MNNNNPQAHINCLIIEDEPLSQEILESYISNCPELKLIGVCKSAIEGNTVLHQKKIDLIFLDINMPIINGIDWLKTLENTPEVIFTTAYPEHAVEGFDLNILDYLLKPFSFDRFLKSINKYKIFQKDNSPNQSTQEDKTLLVKSNKKTYPVNLSDIYYIESHGDYLKLYRENDHLLLHETLKSFINKLPANRFLKVHRSFVINIQKVEYIEA